MVNSLAALCCRDEWLLFKGCDFASCEQSGEGAAVEPSAPRKSEYSASKVSDRLIKTLRLLKPSFGTKNRRLRFI